MMITTINSPHEQISFPTARVIHSSNNKTLLLVESNQIPSDDNFIYHRDDLQLLIPMGDEDEPVGYKIRSFYESYELAGATILELAL